MGAYDRMCYVGNWHAELLGIAWRTIPRTSIVQPKKFRKKLNQKTADLHPAYIYHYTDARALLSMVETRQLWLTDSRFLNDKDEVLYLYKICHNKIMTKLSNSNYNNRSRFLEFLIEGLTANSQWIKSFTMSFSRELDSYNQWMLYGSDGFGYALEFDTAALLTLQDIDDKSELNLESIPTERPYKRSIYLSKVLYDEPSVTSIIDSYIDKVSKLGCAWDGGYEDEVKATVCRGVQGFLHHLGSLYKRKEFAGEHEYRLTEFIGFSRDDPYWGQNVYHVSRRNVITPIIKVNCSNLLDGLVNRVVVGPRHDESALLGLKNLFMRHKIEIPVSLSTLSIR